MKESAASGGEAPDSLGTTPRILPAQSVSNGSSSTKTNASPPLSDTVSFIPRHGDAPLKQKLFGQYELLSEIARGGMGVVYRARQVKLNRLVALKMIRSGELADEEQVQRFYAEAEAAGKLDHPDIVPIYEVGQAEGQHFFSMALVTGISLNEKVKTDGPLVPREAARLLKSVVEAVEYAHGKGIIHRDIKPQNILLDESGRCRLTDFGLAKQVKGTSDLTATGQVMGTPSYMPPEQARGRLDEIGPASDVYSLGATLYFVLSGRPPFQTASSAETILQVLNSEPVGLRKLNPAIPRDLETICLKCLKKEPASRYTTAAELAADLGRWLDDVPILARRTSIAEHVISWCRRNSLVATLATAVTVMAILGTVVAIWQARTGSDLKATVHKQQKHVKDANRKVADATKQAADATNKVAAAEGLISTEKKKSAGVAQERDTAKELAAKKAKEAALANDEEKWQEYITDLLQVKAAWDTGQLAQVRALLDKHRIPSGDSRKDYRGIEWYYWDTRLQNNSQFLPKAVARSAAFSVNGRFLATANETHATLWNLETQTQVHRWAIGRGRFSGILDASDRHSQFDHSVALSPDGTLLAATAFWMTKDQRLGSVRVWDVASGEERFAALDSLEISGRAVVFSPDSRYLLAGGYSNRFKSWNLSTKKEETPLLKVPSYSPPEYPSVVKPGTPFSGRAIVWELAFWNDALMCRCDELGPAFPVWPRADGSPPTRIRDDVIRRQPPHELGQIKSAFGLDLDALYAVIIDENSNSLDLHRMGNPRVRGVTTTRLEGGPAFCVVARGPWVAATGWDRVTRIWNLNSTSKPRELRGAETVEGLAIRPDGNVIAALPGPVPNHPGICLWNLEQNDRFELPKVSSHPAVLFLARGPRGNLRAELNMGLIRIVTADDTEVAHFSRGQYLPGQVWFSSDENYFAVSTSSKSSSSTELWDAKTGKRIAILPHFTENLNAGCFSPDCSLFAGGGRLWEVASGNSVLDCGGAVTTSTAFSPSGRLVAFARQGRCDIWDVSTGKLVLSLPRTGSHIAFQADETRILLASKEICVWDLLANQEVPTAFGQFEGAGLALSRDGRRLYLPQTAGIEIYSNRTWNHLLTLPIRHDERPRNAQELEPLFDEIIRRAGENGTLKTDRLSPTRSQTTPEPNLTGLGVEKEHESKPAGASEVLAKGKESRSSQQPGFFRPRAIWTGTRTYRQGAWKGKTVSYELHIQSLSGEAFKGHVFDNGRGKNRAAVEGTIRGGTVSWREMPGANSVVSVEGTLEANEIKLNFIRKNANGSLLTKGDGVLKGNE